MRPSAAPTCRACSAGSMTALCSADGNVMDLSRAPAYEGSTSQALGMHSNTCMHDSLLQPLLLLLLRSCVDGKGCCGEHWEQYTGAHHPLGCRFCRFGPERL